MQSDMGSQIAPPVLLEVKARSALALVRRQQLTPAIEIDPRVIELHCPNMDSPFKRRNFGRRCRPRCHKPRGRVSNPLLVYPNSFCER